MALLDARCTSCGAALKVNGALDAANCESCGAAFVVEKAVRNFYVNIQAQNVVVQGGVREDFEIRGGVLVKYHGNAEEVVIPDGVVEIGKGAFHDCAVLRRVILPEGIERIGESAFMNCRRLEATSLPDGLTEICDEAFRNCASLADIRFSSSVQKIGRSAFGKCAALTKLSVPANVTQVDIFAFSDCAALTEVIIYAEDIELLTGAFGDCGNLERVVLEGKTVKNSSHSAPFDHCGKLTIVQIGQSVEQFDRGMFYDTPCYKSRNKGFTVSCWRCGGKKWNGSLCKQCGLMH